MRNLLFVGLGAVTAILIVFCAITMAQEEKILDDGEWLSCTGQLTKAGDRPAIKITEGENSGKIFIIIENSKLEELEKIVKETGQVAVEISCDVTKYNKKNFLIITHFQKTEEDDEEDDSEDKEEGK